MLNQAKLHTLINKKQEERKGKKTKKAAMHLRSKTDRIKLESLASKKNPKQNKANSSLLYISFHFHLVYHIPMSLITINFSVCAACPVSQMLHANANSKSEHIVWPQDKTNDTHVHVHTNVAYIWNALPMGILPSNTAYAVNITTHCHTHLGRSWYYEAWFLIFEGNT